MVVSIPGKQMLFLFLFAGTCLLPDFGLLVCRKPHSLMGQRKLLIYCLSNFYFDFVI